jgi:hypothetical protein
MLLVAEGGRKPVTISKERLGKQYRFHREAKTGKTRRK